jgi:hypothetical protein
MTGFAGHAAHALPLDLPVDAMRRYRPTPLHAGAPYHRNSAGPAA